VRAATGLLDCRWWILMGSSLDMTFDAIGIPEEQRNCFERHPYFFMRAVPRLNDALVKVFGRPFAPGENHPVIIFLLDQFAVEDFMEILLLSGNGYGSAALRLLRGMFERVVHARYLSRHPEELQAFLDYDYVHQMRGLRHGVPLPDDQREEVERQYARVKEQFLDSRGGVRGSWTRMDLRTMAEQVGLGDFYVTHFYWPTLKAHTTVMALKVRLKDSEGKVTLIQGPQRSDADLALCGAHMLIAFMLEDHNDHFALALDEEIAVVKGDFTTCWDREPGVLA